MIPATEKKESRFSDEHLHQFQDEFRHHVRRCEERFNTGDSQFKELIQAQKANTDAMSSLIAETREIVQLHNDVKSVVRVGKGIQAVATWFVKWPLIGAGLYGIANWFCKQFPGV